jgi:hypothetical protein
MLLNNGNGTFTGGPLDAIMILHNIDRGTYHAAFFEEHPLPGPVLDVEKTKLVRLQSRFHHTEGSLTFEGAVQHVKELAEKITLPKENIFKDKPREWDGKIGITYLVDNWRASDTTTTGKERK